MKMIFTGICETMTVVKYDGSIACGIYLSAGLKWTKAKDQCSQIGARLPEIQSFEDNQNFLLWKVNSFFSSNYSIAIGNDNYNHPNWADIIGIFTINNSTVKHGINLLH